MLDVFWAVLACVVVWGGAVALVSYREQIRLNPRCLFRHDWCGWVRLGKLKNGEVLYERKCRRCGKEDFMYQEESNG